MLIEQPTFFYKLFYPGAIFRIPTKERKTAYLTFDDGPIPEVTPWVLDILDQYKIKATFFCVGDNVFKYPDLFKQILQRGHKVGNHTFNHIRSYGYNLDTYLRNVEKANELIDSPLFRPPHGELKRWHYKALLHQYSIVFFDVVTRDYNPKLSPDRIVGNVKKYTRNGSIIVFHDSKKSFKNIETALPRSIEWLLEEGYDLQML